MSYSLAIMDYGIGGIDLFKRVKKVHPGLPMLYFSDSGYIPYGRVPKKVLENRVNEVIEFLRSIGVQRIVVACHSASSVVKPEMNAVLGIKELTINCVLKSGVDSVGIIGGGRTIKAQSYKRALEQHGIEVMQRIAQELSILIERGELDSDYAIQTIKRIIKPLRKQQALLLACTHYPALTEQIRELFPSLKILDPISDVLENISLNDWLSNTSTLPDRFYTSGNPELMVKAARKAFDYVIDQPIALYP